METATPMETEVLQGYSTEAEVVQDDPMEADDARPNTYLFGHSGDSDSDSNSRWKSRLKSMFWYDELSHLRDIPDYCVLPYPWEEDEQRKGKDKDGEEGSVRNRELEDELFLRVMDTTWCDLPEEHWKRGRWEEQEQPRMVWRKSDASSSSCLERVPDPQQHILCTSAEVLRVRMEMHECYEKGISYHRLFKSKANRDELVLPIPNADDEPYSIIAARIQRDPTLCSYAHVFPELYGTDPEVSCEWLKPTTLEGDEEYLQFFPQLMEVAKYGETKDHVLAKAIVLARKSFQKMLRFQLDIAVRDCIKLMKNEEAIKRRYNLYYFSVSEIVLNKMDFKSVLKSIRDGDSGLPYGLTEFTSCTDLWDGIIAEIVGYLAKYFDSERQRGMYKEWVYGNVDMEVARIICELVDSELTSPCHLYERFLRKKIMAAQELGLVTFDEDINPECASTTDMQVISEEGQEA